MQRIGEFLMDFGKKRIKSKNILEQYEEILHISKLDTLRTFTKEDVLCVKDELNEFIERYRNKSKKRRYMDFNQGLDVAILMKRLLSQLPIMPMRIAFDRLTLRNPYERAIRLAVKYGIRHLSNYILFNYDDTP